MDSLFRELSRELGLALRDRVVLFTLLGITALSIYSVATGLSESAAEQATIERVKKLANEDRDHSLASQSDAGGAAYYAFHFTYDPPSSLAFVSRGIRDDLPWKHRVRMLALEGQIYETDSGNPELSRIGKLDFAFVAAFLLPLLSILLLYDLRAGEIRNNRWAFLSVTSGNGNQLLRVRASLRSALLFIGIILPFIVSAVINGADFWDVMLVVSAVAFNLVFWRFIAQIIFKRVESGPTTAALLLGCWFIFSVVIPVGGKLVVEQVITVPKGGEILLTQREAVNDAWDLPKEATMVPFFERHPQWVNSPEITKAFEWKWYYAFQQVGDQNVERLSEQLRSGIARRDHAMGLVSFASPSLLTKRFLSRAANTDVASFQRYDSCVRSFHLKLREFYYPMLFGNIAYSSEQMRSLPAFVPCTDRS